MAFEKTKKFYQDNKDEIVGVTILTLIGVVPSVLLGVAIKRDIDNNTLETIDIKQDGDNVVETATFKSGRTVVATKTVTNPPEKKE